jgi:hypothetical protein
MKTKIITKLTTKLLLSSLVATSLTGGFAMANEKIVKGTTIGHYQKPGAPIDMTHETQRVAVDEVADVHISFSTSLQSGEMEISIDLDENLKREGEAYDSIRLPISPSQKEYTLDLKVSSSKDGLYYVRLLSKVETPSGTRMRAFAVPVYVGSGELNRKTNQVIMKAMSGENLSISKAEESIEEVEE